MQDGMLTRPIASSTRSHTYLHLQNGCLHSYSQHNGICVLDFAGHCRRPNGVNEYFQYWGDCLLEDCENVSGVDLYGELLSDPA